MRKRYLETGKIVSTHGIRGEVRVQPWCDDAALLTELPVLYYDAGKTRVRVELARVHKNIVILKIAGVDTMEAAQALRGRVLYLDREDLELPEGTFFVQDLVGCTVADADDPDTVYGTIEDVTETGANDIYHVRSGDGRLLLVPVIDDVVRDVDPDAGMVRITPLRGLFDDED